MTDKFETSKEFEKRMIQQFNARVNQRNTGLNQSGFEEQTISSKMQSSSQFKNSLTVTGKLSSETGGPKGLEPTRYGDWEAKGRCYDF